MTTIKVILIVILCTFAYFALLISIGLLRERQIAKPEVYSGLEIHLAALNGDFEKIKVLLSQNKELINARDKYGNVPLHLAAFKGHTKIVEFSIANGADVNIKNNFGATALYMASYSGNEQIVKILIAHGQMLMLL